MTAERHRTHHHQIYGLCCDEYDALLERAAGACELCDVTPPPRNGSRNALWIDHDHSRPYGDNVRGMVCARCNAKLRRIDSGEYQVCDRVAAYLANSWHTGGRLRQPLLQARRRTQ